MNNRKVVASYIEKGCELWRSGDDQDGIRCFQQASLLWLDWLEEQEDQEDQELSLSKKMLNEVIPLMKKLMISLKEDDIIRATDILEYEILPILKSDLKPE